jgi:hypothetical protein
MTTQKLIEVKELQLDTKSKLYRSKTWPTRLPKNSVFQSYKIDHQGNVSLFFANNGCELEERWFSNSGFLYTDLGLKLVCQYDHFYIGPCFVYEWTKEQAEHWDKNLAHKEVK